MITYQIYYQNTFFLSDKIVKHSLTAETLLEVIASIGGLHRIIDLVLRFIGLLFNRRALKAKFIRNMYFIKKKKSSETNDDPSGAHKDLLTTFALTITTIHVKLYHQFCWRFCSKVKKQPWVNQKDVFEEGAKRLSQDLSLFNVFQSISKLKATVNVLVDEREDMLRQIKGQYYKDNTLYFDEDEKKEYNDHKSSFQKFMEHDLRRDLRNHEN